MKKFITISIMLALFASSASILAQPQEEESLGLPGDNLNLYAVMKLFQESETLEGFEKNLNDENSKINNLDLNGDNYIDYIRVVDYPDGNDHTIVLQVPMGAQENQDVAVFTVQRDVAGKVYIQLIGDVALYGKDYIIEPYYNTSETPNPGYAGNTRQTTEQITIINTSPVEIASWPVITYIYLPTYSPWRSSWYWGYYPPYWRPWRPYYWHYYYGYHYNWHNHYYGHFHRYPQHRYNHYNDFYYSSRRSNSINVDIRVKAGSYKSTYSRPESRRDGEAAFVKSNPNASRRSTENSSVTGSSRRSDQISKSSDDRSVTSTTRRTEQTSKSSDDRSVSDSRKNSDQASRADDKNRSTSPRSFSTMKRESAEKQTSGQKATNSSNSRQSSTKASGSSERRSSGSSKSSTTQNKSETKNAAGTTKPDRRK